MPCTVMASRAISLIHSLQFVRHLDFTQRRADFGSTGGSLWGISVGEFTAWGSYGVEGSVTTNGDMQYSMGLQYGFWDPYDWDPAKGGIPAIFARFHLEGIAKQFLMTGSMAKSVQWQRADGPPAPPPPTER